MAEKLHIHKDTVKRILYSLILLILAIITGIVEFFLEISHGYVILSTLLIFMVGEVILIIYFEFPEVRELIQRGNIIESIEGEETVYKKLLDVVNLAQDGDEIYVIAYKAPGSGDFSESLYKLSKPDLPQNTDEHPGWKYYKTLHKKVLCHQIKLRRLAVLNPVNKEDIPNLSTWFESHWKERQVENLDERYYKLRYTLKPYYRRILYLKPKDINRSPICILEIIDKIPAEKGAFYVLYIQSDALRDSFEKEICYFFEDVSSRYTNEKKLSEIFKEKWG